MSIFYTKNTQKKMSSRKNRGASVRLSSDNEQNKVRKIAANLKNAMCIMLGAGFIYFTVMYFGEFYENLNEQKIEFVKIEGSLDYISEEEVSSVVSRFTDTSLVTVDLGLVKQQLEMNPWVQSVSIRREWPETLIININEMETKPVVESGR
jgi:cell division septal protein FtsQ